MTLPFAGIVVVWSDVTPVLQTHRIPAGGLAFGDTTFAVEGNEIVITDNFSATNTFINGKVADPEGARPPFPAIVRMGNTIAVPVDDVRPYENASIARHGNLVVATSLARACQDVEVAAVEEEHLQILGTRSVGMQLALDYAERVGGKHAVIDTVQVDAPLAVALERAGSVRTIILGANRTFEPFESEPLATWLETDVRFVTVAYEEGFLRNLPTRVQQQLTARQAEVPMCRFDELPTTLTDMLAAWKPKAMLHASLVEAVLIRALDKDEDLILADVRRTFDYTPDMLVRHEHFRRHSVYS